MTKLLYILNRKIIPGKKPCVVYEYDIPREDHSWTDLKIKEKMCPLVLPVGFRYISTELYPCIGYDYDMIYQDLSKWHVKVKIEVLYVHTPERLLNKVNELTDVFKQWFIEQNSSK